MNTMMRKIQAAVLGLALLAPAEGAFAATHHYRHHHRTYVTYRHHRHHYSETRGTLVGAAAGAIIDHHQPLKGAVIGGVLGNVVQKVRNHH
jgi:hypothetical protein